MHFLGAVIITWGNNIWGFVYLRQGVALGAPGKASIKWWFLIWSWSMGICQMEKAFQADMWESEQDHGVLRELWSAIRVRVPVEWSLDEVGAVSGHGNPESAYAKENH